MACRECSKYKLNRKSLVLKTKILSTRQRGSVAGFLFVMMAVGVFIYFLLLPGNNKDVTQVVTDPIVELSAAQPSSLRPDGELAELFALGTKSTELQRENKLAQIRGQVVQWTLPVYEVSRAGDRYKVQTQGNDRLLMENKNLLLGAFIYLSSRNQQDSQVIAALKTGDLISVKGRIADSSVRNLVLDPAVLVYQSSTSDATKTESADLALSIGKVTKMEDKKTIASSLETRYGAIKIVEKKGIEDNYQLFFRGTKLDESDVERLWFEGKYELHEQDAILLKTISSNPRNGAEFVDYRLLVVRSKDDAKLVPVGGSGGRISIEDGSDFAPKVVKGDLVMNLGFNEGLLRKAVYDGRILSITSKKPSLDEVFPIASNHCSDVFYVVQNYCTRLESCIVPKDGIQLMTMDSHKGHHPALTTAKFSELCRTACEGQKSLSEPNFKLEFCGIK